MAKTSQPKGMPRLKAAHPYAGQSARISKLAPNTRGLTLYAQKSVWGSKSPKQQQGLPKRTSVWDSMSPKQQRSAASADRLDAARNAARNSAAAGRSVPLPHNKLKQAMEGVRKSRGKKYKPTGSGKWRTINGARVFIPD